MRTSAHSRSCVVGDLDLPDPRRAAAVPAAGDGVDRPVDDRAQEARLVGEPLRGLAEVLDREPGRHRGHRLRDRGEDAAVDQARGLAQLVAHGDLGADLLVGQRVDLQAVEAVEARQLAPGERRRVFTRRAL